MMRVVLRFAGRAGLAAVVIAFAGFFLSGILANAGLVLTTDVRFRVVQILDEFVIDLEDSTPGEVPRYNTIDLGDLDEDGSLDLVSVDTDEGAVRVQLGNGNGTFADPEFFDTGDALFPIAVVIGDFTSLLEDGGGPDGNLDLFLIDEEGEIGLLIGNGDGTFDEPDQTIEFVSELADEISGAVAADFNGDGDLDLAIADFDEVIFVCNNDGLLESCPTGVVVVGAETADIVDLGPGDFDGDGALDVVAISPSTDSAYVLYGDGAGNFTLGFPAPPLFPNTGPDQARLAVGRLNDDDIDDFAVTANGFDPDNAQTFLGQSGRRIDRFTFGAPEDVLSMVIGDFDGDGASDLIFVDSNTISFLAGDNTGDFSATAGAIPVSDPRVSVDSSRMAGAEALKAGDVDRDSLTDLVGLTGDGTQIEVALNVRDEPTPTGGPSENTPTPSPTLPGPTATFTIPPPTATPTSVPTAPLGRCDYTVSTVTGAAPARGVAVANLNGTGGPDIAVSDGSRVYVIYNDSVNALRQCARDHFDGEGPTAPPSSVMLAVSGAGDLAALDADDDGDLEIAVARPNRVSFLRRNSQNMLEEIPGLEAAVPGNPVQIVTNYASNPIDQRVRAPLDLDRDGNTDVLVANDGANSITILYGNAGSSAFSVVPVSINAPSRSVTAGDVDGDGRVDIVVATTGRNVFYYVQGAPSGGRPTFSSRGTVQLGNPPVALQTGFFNDDALADVFVADRAPAARILVTRAALSDPTNILAYPLANQPSAAMTLLFDPLDARLDGVVAVQAANQLTFGLGSGDGNIERVLSPLATGPMPRDLDAADLDGDTQTDVVTANDNGTVSILISSEPPPTPTPTITQTPENTETPTITPTITPTGTPTPTITDTPTPTTPTATPTTPKPGTFQLSGGCAIDRSGSPVMPLGLLLGAGVLTAARRRRGVRR